MQFLSIVCRDNMKLFAFFVVYTLTVALVMAFPSNTIADLPVAGVHADETANRGPGSDDIINSPTAWIREPRHLLKKLFHHEPDVVVQPIIVQPQPVYPNPSPIYGSGRGYGYSGSSYSAGYGYAKPVGYW